MSSILTVLLVICAINSINCYYQDVEQPSQADLQPMELEISHAAEVIVTGKKKNNDTFGGTVHLFQFEDEYVEIMGMICGLKPNSTHALHVHTFGEIHPNCSATLGDFNPYGQFHGAHKNDRIEDRHLGDLGNIKADRMGVARFKLKDYNLRIDNNDIFSILGRSIVIHSKRDDLGNNKVFPKGSKHKGTSGLAVACGTIGFADIGPMISKPLKCMFADHL